MATEIKFDFYLAKSVKNIPSNGNFKVFAKLKYRPKNRIVNDANNNPTNKLTPINIYTDTAQTRSALEVHLGTIIDDAINPFDVLFFVEYYDPSDENNEQIQSNKFRFTFTQAEYNADNRITLYTFDPYVNNKKITKKSNFKGGKTSTIIIGAGSPEGKKKVKK